LRRDPASAQRLDRSSGRELLHEATFTDLRRRLRQMTRQRSISDAEVWINREVWDDVCGLVQQAVQLVHHEAGTPHAEGSVHVSFTALMFELDDRARS
jgi:hypothetical protein